MKPKTKRLLVVLVSLASIFTGTYILLNNFRDNLIYFYAPKDIDVLRSKEPEKFGQLLKKQIRAGGMIKEGSYHNKGLDHDFIITDFSNELEIKYTGILPPMFKEGQGVVAQGSMVAGDNFLYFQAKQLITKHDEKYMPPEISRSLKVK